MLVLLFFSFQCTHITDSFNVLTEIFKSHSVIVIFLIKISLHSFTLHRGPYGSVLLRKGKIACTWFFVAGFFFFVSCLFVFFNFLLINTVEYLLFFCLFAATNQHLFIYS